MSSYTDKIAALRREADEMEAAEQAFRDLPEDERLAITLHSLLCHWNHTDGCGWEYEGSGNKTDWNGWAHAEYLKKGRKLLSFCQCNNISTDHAVAILKMSKEI